MDYLPRDESQIENLRSVRSVLSANGFRTISVVLPMLFLIGLVFDPS